MAGKIDPYIEPPLPYWIASIGAASYPVLKEDIRVDAAIVGGGLVGITAAYLLMMEDLNVAIIEANRVGRGTSGHTTAKITSQHSLIYDKLIRRFGPEKARQYAEANENAVAFLENLIKKNNIDCDFSSQPAYIYTQQEQYIKQIEDEIRAAISLGINAHYLEQIPLPFGIKAAERFDNQAQFHPGKFLSALAALISRGGGRIHEHTRAVDFLEGHPFTIITETGHLITADKVVMASHFPVYDGGGRYFTRAFPDRSYALAITAKEKFPGGIYISAESPGRSLRSTPYNGGELILVVGEHHRTGQGPPTGNYYRNLAQFAEQTFTVTGAPFRWSAQDYITLDEVPYVGRITQGNANVFVATGFRKWGITNGAAAALLIRDLIVHGESPWEEIYNPARFEPDPMMQKSISMNIDTAKQAAAGQLESIPPGTEPAPGKAAVVSVKEGKMGLYRDNRGQMHAVGLTCTHMGCEPAWNEAELTWDCPCHGSRYTVDGEIIEGPTLKPLKTGDNLYSETLVGPGLGE